MPRVLNKRSDKIPSEAILVDRTTEWGNFVYKVKDHSLEEHNKAVELFRQNIMLEKNTELRNKAKIILKGHDVVCWCVPLPCHGNVWLEIANEI